MQPRVTHLECHACGREDFETINDLLEHDCEDGGAAPALLADGGDAHGDAITIETGDGDTIIYDRESPDAWVQSDLLVTCEA